MYFKGFFSHIFWRVKLFVKSNTVYLVAKRNMSLLMKLLSIIYTYVEMASAKEVGQLEVVYFAGIVFMIYKHKLLIGK